MEMRSLSFSTVHGEDFRALVLYLFPTTYDPASIVVGNLACAMLLPQEVFVLAAYRQPSDQSMDDLHLLTHSVTGTPGVPRDLFRRFLVFSFLPFIVYVIPFNPAFYRVI
jgi:hypothetical protein